MKHVDSNLVSYFVEIAGWHFKESTRYPYSLFRYHDSKALCVVYITANQDFQKIVIWARSNIFHVVFASFNSQNNRT